MIFKKERGLRVFFCKSWAPFFKIKQGWAPFMPGFCPHFQRFFPNFQEFCPDFQGFCPDFQKIKTVGGALALPAPSLLHHCCCRRGRYSLTHRCQKQSLRSWTALQEQIYPSALMNTSGGSGGAIQPQSSARGTALQDRQANH